MADILVLGAAAALYQPDALANFSSSESIESAVLLRAQSKRFAPLGPSGELTWVRALITGYHRGAFAFFFTPWLDGRELRELRTYISRPGPSEGKEARFDILVPLYRISNDFPDIRLGLRGSVIDGMVEITDPADRFDLETITFQHEPLDDVRARSVHE